MNKKTLKKGLLPYLFLVIAILGIMYFFNIANQKMNILTYDEFINSAKEGKITEIVIVPRSNAGLYELKGTMEGYKENESFLIRTPYSDEVMSQVITLQQEKGFKMNAVADPDSSTVLLFIVNILPSALLIFGAFFIITRQMGSANKSMDFGRSRARLNEDARKVTFKEVAGLDEEKEEVAELIDFLKNPKKFQRLGARIPKGVLLVGPPGTGKTLLARAVAGEANVPFYYISGSEFVELFVGVGASRVRDMFKQAKQSAPCLIFIDEIDAVGRQRGAGLGGGHDEREQTLNQLLTEMDGFGANEGIIIIAATNRPDVLDPALLRPGRFDRQVTVNLPDIKGREEILEVHAKGKTFAKGVKLANIAKRTVGFSGADLENLLNEAALLAVRRNKDVITMAEIDEAHDRVLMGPAKKSHKYTDKENKLQYVHQTSWGMTTRMIGAIIMVHGDNSGLVLPPRIAPTQAVIIPIQQRKEGVLEKADEMFAALKAAGIRVKVDDTDKSPGFKFAEQEMRGIPVRIECGPKDIENGQAVICRRDTREKYTVKFEELAEKVQEILETIQKDMLERARAHRDSHTYVATNYEEFKDTIVNKPGFVKAMWCGDRACEDKIKEDVQATSRCMPFEQEHLSDVCVCCGKPAKKMVYWGRAY